MDREAWAAAAHGVAKSWTRLSNWTELKFSHHELPVFVCLEKSLSLLHFWRITLPGKVFLVSRFFFQCFEYIIPLSLACKVSAEKSADSLWRFLHKWYASFLLFSFFFSIFHFWQFCFNVSWRHLWIKFVWKYDFVNLISKFLPLYRKLSAIISSNKLSVSIFLISSWNSQ